MLDRVLAWSIRRRWVVLVAALCLVFAGAQSLLALPIDAVPDITNVQVQVLTSAPSLGPLDVERLVTAPVERAVAGLPRLREIRSLSRYGVSAVTAVFYDDVSPATARLMLGERLAQARAAVPPSIGTPELGPMSSGLGEIYQFEVRGEGRTPMELREILDWEVTPRLRMVPGLVDVNVFGGELRTFEVSVDPQRLVAHGLTLGDVYGALQRTNRVAGGGAILRGPQGLVVRGDGLVRSLDDLRRVVVARRGDAPVLVGALGDVRFAPMLRQGAASRDGRGEAVVGMAVMLLGENSRTVSTAVADEVREINRVLPRGVRIDPFYDRTELVEKTLRTVGRNLAEGGALVILVLLLMLRNLRAGLVGAAMIPLCTLGAFIGMRAAGVSGNLMSLGALDFGLLVDGAIILLENAVHHLAARREALGRPLTARERDAVVLASAREVRSATAFGELIIALVYVPVLALEGVEGKMFHPMALTVLFALATAFALSLTLVPAAASIILSRETRDLPSPLLVAARRVYAPLLATSLRRPVVPLAVAAALLVLSVAAGRSLGSEFVPRLDEGSIVIEVNRLPSTSLEESVRQAAVIERTLQRFSEVVTVVSKTGRPEIANDPMGVEQSDVFVMLRPRAAWPPPADRERLVARMSDALREALPGVAFGFSQPIEMRSNELLSGVRADVAVRLYGDDLATLSSASRRVARALSSTPGAVDVRADRVEGLPVLRVEVDRGAVARYGASVDDVLLAVDAVGGVTVGEVIEGRRRFPLRMRLSEGARVDVEALRRVPLHLGGGAIVPVEAVARVEVVDEPQVVNHDAGRRCLIVQCNVRGRDLGGFVTEARRRVDEAARLPAGYHARWGGQFENLARARLRLSIVVPAVLALIFALLYASFGDVRPAALIFANVPFAAVGGVLALWARAMPLSISAGVGFIALFGVAVLNGLVLVTQVRASLSDGMTAHDAAVSGALRRLRPVLTTAAVASLGFLPMALATGEGAEVQRPLATVVIGGLLSATLLTLLVLPALCARLAGGWQRAVPRDVTGAHVEVAEV